MANQLVEYNIYNVVLVKKRTYNIILIKNTQVKELYILELYVICSVIIIIFLFS